MPIETTYTQARDNFASYLDKVVDDREIVIVHRRNLGDAAIIAADELESLMETAYLLSSPRNAMRLLSALNSALANEGTTLTSLEELRREVGLDTEGKD
jgi:antitoxin YefM